MREPGSGDAFRGVIQLYGKDNFERFQSARILVVGLGGVGSWVAEGLARSGIGSLDLCDLDEICVNNINRQLQAIPSTVGQAKVKVLAQRVKSVSPQCRVAEVEDFFTRETVGMLDALSEHVGDTLVVDAIDSLANKALLVDACLHRGLRVLCSGAAGGRRDPAQIRSSVLSSATVDPLLRNLRRVLRKSYQRDASHMSQVDAVFSTEQVGPLVQSCEPSHEGGQPSIRPRSCDAGLGTAVHVTASMGFHIVGQVLERLSEPKEGL